MILQPMEFDMSKIYEVKDLSEAYGGESTYGIEDTLEGVVVSVWDCHEMAQDIANELEWSHH